jgi:predicted nucleic acid-binding protein
MRLTLDANILVYAVDRADHRHAAAVEIVSRAARVDCVQTLQSLAEFFVVATRRGKASGNAARRIVDGWRSVFPVCAANERALELAMSAVAEHTIAFWDAMLWSTAKLAGCRLLLSEDLQDGRNLEGVRFINPFNTANRTLVETALQLRSR